MLLWLSPWNGRLLHYLWFSCEATMALGLTQCYTVGHDSSMGRWMYLTVCPLCGPGHDSSVRERMYREVDLVIHFWNLKERYLLSLQCFEESRVLTVLGAPSAENIQTTRLSVYLLAATLDTVDLCVSNSTTYDQLLIRVTVTDNG